MAVTKTTSIASFIYAKWLSPVFQVNARHYNNPEQFCAGWNPPIGTSTVSVPKYNTNEGTPTDHGVSVDTELDATEASALTPIELTGDAAEFTIREYGMSRELSYTATEDTIDGSVFGYVQQDLSRTLMTALNDDVTANFAAFTNASGTPGSAMELADLDDALFDLAERGVMGTLVGILSHQQVRDWHAGIEGAGTSQAIYAGAADRLKAASADAQQGRNQDGYAFSYKGVNFHRSGLTDTANAAADDVGAIFVDGADEANRPMAAIGKGARRPFTLEFDRDVLKRTVILVGTMRQGAGITQNFAGQKIVTKTAA